MDTKEYIHSGVLEAYLSGELSEAEMKAVDRIVGLYPEIALHIDELRTSLNRYATATGKLPSEAILQAALNKIKEDEKGEFLKVIDQSGPEVVIKRINVLPRWSIAATILLFVSFCFNAFFYGQMVDSRQELRAMVDSNNTLAQKIETVDQELTYAALRVAHFLDEDNVHIHLDGSEISPNSFANVFWNTKSNAVFISVDNLPEPPSGHQYQLWAIEEGKSPIDAGIFDHTLLVQKLKVIKGAVVAFAVTLEKEGGTPIATVDQTFAKGFLKKS
ncbi:MAG: hypothetical protein ACJAXX_002276 [Roseivirga sp.]|jgi:hypothetical protein